MHRYFCLCLKKQKSNQPVQGSITVNSFFFGVCVWAGKVIAGLLLCIHPFMKIHVNLVLWKQVHDSAKHWSASLPLGDL